MGFPCSGQKGGSTVTEAQGGGFGNIFGGRRMAFITFLVLILLLLGDAK